MGRQGGDSSASGTSSGATDSMGASCAPAVLSWIGASSFSKATQVSMALPISKAPAAITAVHPTPAHPKIGAAHGCTRGR